MIKIEHLETAGWEAAIRGMRNPKNSWKHSDSSIGCEGKKCYSGATIIRDGVKTEGCPFKPDYCGNTPEYIIGSRDADLMSRLNKGGPVHAKYRRMITVWCDITAPLYWWKEFDTYKVGTVANSCSTMHKIGENEFTLDDFSCEHMYTDADGVPDHAEQITLNVLKTIISNLNYMREAWLESGKKYKRSWYNMIQLLPLSYNQRRTVELNYEVLTGMYRDRKNHKLDEWREFCKVMKEQLPESWIFTGEE